MSRDVQLIGARSVHGSVPPSVSPTMVAHRTRPRARATAAARVLRLLYQTRDLYDFDPSWYGLGFNFSHKAANRNINDIRDEAEYQYAT